MQRELDSNNAALNDIGKEFDDAEKKTDEFGDELESAGKQADDSSSKFSALGDVCKAVGVTMTAAFAAVSAAAISAGKALVNMAKEGAGYADDILTQSTVTGIATDKLQEYKYAAELVDVSLETLTGSMAKQIKSMKGIEIKGNDIYTVNVNVDYSIEIANEFIKEKNKIIYGNLFASFGCDFILIAIKNKMFATYENKGTKLNDVIVNVVQCLKLTNNTTIMSKAVKILISLFDMI